MERAGRLPDCGVLPHRGDLRLHHHGGDRPRAGPSAPRAVTATDGYRLTGLVNTVIYPVQVLAYSNADNVSDPSFVTTGMPELANDFWRAYQAAGGQEQGGCGYGVAGPIALLAAAAGLALRRRRS